MSASHTLAPEFSALMVIFLIDRPGDLHAAVLQARGRGSDAPVRVVADGLGLAQEPRVLAFGDLLAAFLPCLQQLAPAPAVARCSLATNAKASGVRTSLCRQIGCAVSVIPLMVKLSVKLFMEVLA